MKKVYWFCIVILRMKTFKSLFKNLYTNNNYYFILLIQNKPENLKYV